MADVNINKFRASVVRDGSKPASPGFIVSEGQDPVNPPGTNNYVPYSGATANVELGEFGVEAGFITLDTTPTNTPTDQGTIFWDADDETVDIVLNGYTMKIGEDLFYPVKNQTGSTIAKGVAVRFNGTVGNSGRLLIAPFIADGSVPSTRFMGVTAEEILNGEDGKVLYFGRVRGINTNAFNEGDILYASTTVAGGYQTAIPVAPNNIVQVAAVVTKSATVGTIFVRPTLGSNINKDEGVKIVSVADKNLLQYQSGTSLWENKSLAQVLGGTSAQFVKGDGSLDSTSYGTGTVTSVGLSSATSGVTIGSTPVTTSGTITLAIATASGSQNGLLSSTDWTTFNSKQNALTNPVTGTGAQGRVAYWNGSGTITSDSLFQWNDFSKRLGIGRTPTVSLDVEGAGFFSGTVTASSIIKSGGTSSQYLMADGSVSTLTNPVTGTGTTNYLPKFTGASTIGNSNLINDASGNLGLGINPTNVSNYIRLQISGTTGAIFDLLSGSTRHFTIYNDSSSSIIGTVTNTPLIFQTNDGTKMTLAANGNLLVGTTTDNGAKLQVSGSGVAFNFTTSNGLIGNINSSAANGGYVTWQTSGTTIADIGTAQQVFGAGGSDTFGINARGSRSLILGTNNTARLTIASTGAATFSSSVTAAQFLASSSSNAAIITSTGTTGYGLVAVGSAGGARDIFLAGQSGFSNGFTVQYTGTEMRYGFQNGNVGIGTTSPQVAGGGYTSLHVNGTGASILLSTAGANITYLYTLGTSGVDFAIETPGAQIFRAGSNERMRIASNGNVLIGTTTDNGAKLQVSGTSLITGETTIGNAPSGTNVNFNINGVTNKAGRIRFMESGSVMWVVGNGAASENGRFEIFDNVNGTGVQLLRGATSWTSLSDERFKNIIEPITVNDKLKNIRAVVGKYKTDKDGIRRNFLIAQDLLKVFPEVVDIDNNQEKPMGVRYQDLIPILVSAIQELKQEIDTLKN